jgi:hypothetical protein
MELAEKTAWQRASSSTEIAQKLRTFATDGFKPRPAEGETYYFLPLGKLPWPANSDPAWWMNDVADFYISHFRPPHAREEDILFASTKQHGDIVIVPVRFLPADATGSLLA